jgi:hypothetical protein
MRLTCGHRLIMAASTILVLGVTAQAAGDGFPRGVGEALGSQYETTVTREHRARHRSPSAKGARSWVEHWNEIAIDASGLDHTPVAPGESRIFGEQLGPGRSSRAMAIVHIAISDAVSAIAGDDRSYTGVQSVHGEASMKAAIAQAAHDTLVAVFPSQAASFDAQLAEDLGRIHNQRGKANGIETGQRAAAAILAGRSDDGSQHAEPRIGIEFITGNEPGMWRQDPISLIPIALGAHWGAVRPFVLPSAAQFRAPPPPALNSPEYAAAFEEVMRLGGDGVVTPTERTDDQTTAGIYWAYDGTPSLCAPPRLYNQIAVQIAEQMGSNVIELARLLALVNVAMADAGIAIWESKYHYNFWRPVTGIREADEGTGPPAPVTAIRRPSATRPSALWGHRPATSPARTSLLRSPPIHRAMPGSAVPCSRSCAASMGPTGSRSPSSRTNSTGRLSTTEASSARRSAATSRRSPTRRKRTVKAGSTWAFTGRSTRPRALPRAGG